MIRRPPRSTRTDTLFPTRRSSDLAERDDDRGRQPGDRGSHCRSRPGGTQPRAHRGSGAGRRDRDRSEEHTSELQSLMRISYAVFCLKKKHTSLKMSQLTNGYYVKQLNYIQLYYTVKSYSNR